MKEGNTKRESAERVVWSYERVMCAVRLQRMWGL